ncbi:MAG: hypothetical protein ACI9FB_000906 [Candidatus Azotimanducaceae bacterium]|jgi:uncharacterized protein YaiL (DUF2058 family)
MAKKKKGGSSLGDQLRAVGLVTEKQLRKAQKGQHRIDTRIRQGIEKDDSKIEVQKIMETKSAIDLEKNKQRDKSLETKSILAQIKQLIEMNKKREKGDVSYNFTLESKIKKIYISEENKKQLNLGHLGIVSLQTGDGNEIELVPKKVAEKIAERNSEYVLYLYEKSKDVIDEDDPYKDFQIPDDLEW